MAKSVMLMGYAQLGSVLDLGFVRIGGHGLGNHLFPWARCVVASRDHDLQLLAPTWFQIKRKPILQLERDMQHYCNLFRHPSDYVSGIRRMIALLTKHRYPEGDLYTGKLDGIDEGIVVFQGMEGRFEPFVAEWAFLRNELKRLSRPEHLRTPSIDFSGSIAIHVRLGDFREPASEHELRAGRTNRRVPMSWFVGVARRLRETLGYDTPIEIFSDGSEKELVDLIELPNTRARHFGSALADLWAMSTAHVLVRPGSTFSMWSSFLGRMPTLCPVGQLHARLYADRPEAEIEYDPDERLPDDFVSLITSPRITDLHKSR